MSSMNPSRRVVTFFSHKGGVGRSMALTNVAWHLSRMHALRVIAVDWDLEAPGLHRFFGYSDEEMAARQGVLDFMLEWQRRLLEGSGAPPEVGDWLLEPQGLPAAAPGWLAILPAGRLDATYGERLGHFNWVDFYQRHQGANAVERLREQLLERADLVLLDSRTGMADVAGICTIQLPDGVILMAATNEQSLAGVERAARAIVSPEALRGGRGRPRIWLALGRVTLIEETILTNAWLTEHEPWFEAGIDEGLWAREDHPKGQRSHLIPHRARWAFGEQSLHEGVEPDRDEPLVAAFRHLAITLLEWAREEGVGRWRSPSDDEDLRGLNERVREAEHRGDIAELSIALFDLGRALYARGRVNDAYGTLQRAAGLHQGRGADAYYGRTLRWLGNLRRSQGRYEEARRLCKQALDISRRLGDRRDEAAALHALGNIEASLRHFKNALERYAESRQLHGESGDRPLEGFTCITMALVCHEQRRYREAQALLDEAQAYLTDANQRERGILLGVLADIARETRRCEEAWSLYVQALAIVRSAGDRRSEGFTLLRMGMLQARRGQHDEALVLLDDALALSHELEDRTTEGKVLRERGSSLARQGRAGEALAAFDQALAIFGDSDDRYEEALTLQARGVALRETGRMNEALADLERALTKLRSYGDGDAYHEALMLMDIGMLHGTVGDPAPAERCFQEGAELARRIGEEQVEAAALDALLHLLDAGGEARADETSRLRERRAALAVPTDRDGVG